MKNILAAAGVFALAFFIKPAQASTDPIGEALDAIFAPDEAALHPHNIGYRGRKHHPYRHIDSLPVAEGGVSSMIASHVSATIGEQWVATALQIARIESGGRCGAMNRSGATGIFQVIHPERFGVSRSAARTCSGGIAAGVAHMRACIAKGANTHSQMLRCHNSGSPYGRVERAYRRYV